MSFIFRYSLEGNTPVFESVPASNVAVSANALVANSSGYADDATAATTSILIGCNQQAVDNSGGSAGDLSLKVLVSPSAVYEVGTADTMAAAHVWKNVAASAGNLTIVSNTAVTDESGVVKIRKMISTSKVLASLNFGSPTDAA